MCAATTFAHPVKPTNTFIKSIDENIRRIHDFAEGEAARSGTTLHPFIANVYECLKESNKLGDGERGSRATLSESERKADDEFGLPANLRIRFRKALLTHLDIEKADIEPEKTNLFYSSFYAIKALYELRNWLIGEGLVIQNLIDRLSKLSDSFDSNDPQKQALYDLMLQYIKDCNQVPLPEIPIFSDYGKSYKDTNKSLIEFVASLPKTVALSKVFPREEMEATLREFTPLEDKPVNYGEIKRKILLSALLRIKEDVANKPGSRFPFADLVRELQVLLTPLSLENRRLNDRIPVDELDILWTNVFKYLKKHKDKPSTKDTYGYAAQVVDNALKKRAMMRALIFIKEKTQETTKESKEEKDTNPLCVKLKKLFLGLDLQNMLLPDAIKVFEKIQYCVYSEQQEAHEDNNFYPIFKAIENDLIQRKLAYPMPMPVEENRKLLASVSLFHCESKEEKGKESKLTPTA